MEVSAPATRCGHERGLAPHPLRPASGPSSTRARSNRRRRHKHRAKRACHGGHQDQGGALPGAWHIGMPLEGAIAIRVHREKGAELGAASFSGLVAAAHWLLLQPRLTVARRTTRTVKRPSALTASVAGDWRGDEAQDVEEIVEEQAEGEVCPFFHQVVVGSAARKGIVKHLRRCGFDTVVVVAAWSTNHSDVGGSGAGGKKEATLWRQQKWRRLPIRRLCDSFHRTSLLLLDPYPSFYIYPIKKLLPIHAEKSNIDKNLTVHAQYRMREVQG